MLADLRIAADHPAYAGHFPGMPILPGAVLLDEVLLEIARARTLHLPAWQVASVKFLETVRPGDPLALEHTQADERSLRFTVRSENRLIATGVLSALSVTRHLAADGT